MTPPDAPDPFAGTSYASAPPQAATVRPGPHFVPPPSTDVPEYTPLTLGQAITAARHLQRVARHWASDPAWPPIRDVLLDALAELADRDDRTARIVCEAIHAVLHPHHDRPVR